MSFTPKDDGEYSFERKKRLASKIGEIRDKVVLKQIKNIIFVENPDVVAKKSAGGYLMFFQNYTNSTYVQIDKLLSKIETDRIDRQTKSIARASENLLSSEEQTNDYENSRSRLRYSNKEKRLIKRQQYETLIIKQNTENLTEFSTENSTITDSEDEEDKKITKKVNIVTKIEQPKTKKLTVATKNTEINKTEPKKQLKTDSDKKTNIFTKVSKS